MRKQEKSDSSFLGERMYHGSSRARLLEPLKTGLKLMLIFSGLTLKELMYCFQFKISGNLFSNSNCLKFYSTSTFLKMMTFTRLCNATYRQETEVFHPGDLAECEGRALGFHWRPLQKTSQISPRFSSALHLLIELLQLKICSLQLLWSVCWSVLTGFAEASGCTDQDCCEGLPVDIKQSSVSKLLPVPRERRASKL